MQSYLNLDEDYWRAEGISMRDILALHLGRDMTRADMDSFITWLETPPVKRYQAPGADVKRAVIKHQLAREFIIYFEGETK